VPKRARKGRRRRHRRSKVLRQIPRRGVTAAASFALGAAAVRDYSVPNWYAGFYGVPGSLLKKKVDARMNEYSRARTLLVRINFLIDRHLGVVGSAPAVLHSRRRPLEVFRAGHLDQPFHEFHGWKTLGRVKACLSRSLEEFVNLPLSELRSGCFPAKGPGCVSCSHDSCRSLFWTQQGRPPKGRSASLGDAAIKLLRVAGAMRR